MTTNRSKGKVVIGWTEPEWLGAHGSYFFEDWCFADAPVLWHPLPPEPVGPVGAASGKERQ